MEKRDETKSQHIPTFAHMLISKLSAIVGHCQLLKEELPRDSAGIDRVCLIEKVANSAVEEIRAKERKK